MTPPTPPGRPRRWFWPVWLLSGVALLAAYLASQYFPRKPDGSKSDPVGAAHANVRGVGHMEQFQYPPAIEAFEEANRLAPDWTPAKINLGIALLNTQDQAHLDRALGLFADVLKADPNDRHAHFCTGIIKYYRNEVEAAHRSFTRVTELDPKDAHAWYWRGRTRPDEATNPDAQADYRKALDLNPYLNAARYALAQHGHDRDEEKSKALLDEFARLKAADWKADADIKYTMMGKYAEVIGGSPAAPAESARLPLFDHRRLDAPGPRLADAGPAAAVRDRFGAAVVPFDFDRDGKPDVLFADGAGVRLLRGEGSRFAAVAWPGESRQAFGAAVADFDNDGWADVLTTGPGGVRLYRNAGGKSFEDKTAEAGFDQLKGVCLGATWVDLDQDGDLDLVVAKYADTPEQAAKLLAGEQLDGGGRLAVFANVGVAPPVPPGQKAPPLSCKFQPAKWPDELKLSGPVVTVVALDADGDGDMDLTVLSDGPGSDVVLNDRLMRFRRMGLPAGPPRRVNGGLVIDTGADDRSGHFTVPHGSGPTVSLGRPDATNNPLGKTDSPALRQAHRCDLDLDGRADVVGLSQDGKPVFLRGDGKGNFRRVPEAFGPDAEKLPGLAGLAVADFDADGNPDLLALAGDGLHLFRSLGNGNYGVKVVLTGRREKGTGEKSLRTNADGVGARVLVHAGPLRTGAENTTLTAGLGQGRLPVHLGLGPATTAEAVRVRWPDGVVQAELNQPADGLVEVVEIDRMPSSCPVLFTWDGRRFAYVTDFLGAGAIGESGPDGSVRPPRPEESVKIEPHQLAPRGGKFVLKVTEPMDEVAYLDYLRLAVIDHPAGVVVFPDERFATAGQQPSQELLVFRDRHFLARATDHRGRDVTAALRHRDREAADGFAVRSWLGYAEEHWVELDFGGSLPPAVRGGPGSPRLFLVLAGWTEYAFPESIYAATQAGVPMVPPVLEQKQPDGTWKSLGDLGFPAGLSRVMTADVTGKLDPAGGPVRIRTNLRVYWDQVFLTPAADPGTATVRELPVARATLGHRGVCQEVTPGGRGPIEYDYDRRDAVAVTRWKGRLTRFGDVTELLTAADDRQAVIGPGDEVTAEFDAAGLPPVPAGRVRSFVLRTAGFCKDAAPTTVSGGRVGPLPYRGMPAYPYPAGRVPPAVAAYDREWNTRPANGGTE